MGAREDGSGNDGCGGGGFQVKDVLWAGDGECKAKTTYKLGQLTDRRDIVPPEVSIPLRVYLRCC